MAERPYISLGVVELEGIFLAATDSDVLEVLQYELNHRTTKAAKNTAAMALARTVSMLPMRSAL